MDDTWARATEVSASACERTQKTSLQVSFSAIFQVDSNRVEGKFLPCSAVLDVSFYVSEERIYDERANISIDL